MKSNKQRRLEIQDKRAKERAFAQREASEDFKAKLAQANQAFEAHRAAERLLVDKKFWVDTDQLRPTNSHDTPDFVYRGYYVDKRFQCKACGATEVWSATQQKWWYETAKGDVWTTAVMCKPCRRKKQ